MLAANNDGQSIKLRLESLGSMYKCNAESDEHVNDKQKDLLIQCYKKDYLRNIMWFITPKLDNLHNRLNIQKLPVEEIFKT